MKHLRNGDFNLGKPLLFKQSRAAKDKDICLLHNKAVVVALESQLALSDSFFSEVAKMDSDMPVLESGWLINWVIVKVRLGDY